jgi:hypothetical protein
VKILNYKILIAITDYITLFPIKWYNLIKKVINKATIYHNVMIVNKNTLVNHKQVFLDIVDILSNQDVVYEISENKDFYILYFRNKDMIKIFDYWLNMITLRAFMDLISEVKCNNVLQADFYIMIGDLKVFVEPKSLDKDNFCVTTSKTKKDNAIIYDYNYFVFREKLNEIYHLHFKGNFV